MDLMLFDGRFGMPFFFLCVEMLRRDSSGICKERCGFVNAHLARVLANAQMQAPLLEKRREEGGGIGGE